MHGNTGRLLLIIVAALTATAAVGAPRGKSQEPTKRSAADIERGRYLVNIAGCNDCHTPGYIREGGNIPEKERLVGSPVGWRGTWGTTYAANLRLYFQELTEEQWIGVAKEIQRRPPMPYYTLNAMKEPDIKAIYRYIRSLGPAGTPAPAFIAADREPPQPYVLVPNMQ